MYRAPNNAIFTVSQLNSQARQLLEITFASVRVEGEISNLSRPSSGHWYFTLKDASAQVRCAMFRGQTSLLKFQPKEGDKVELRGKISLYENRGDYQLIVDAMKPAGEGALLLAFQQLKERLQREGLFATEPKHPLPKHINRVGVVTSATGAAIHDILTVLKRRDPRVEVDIYPTAVQGKEATAQIVAAIERANRDNRVDVLIVGRGGGSLEDLWCFNEEAVARAIFASKIPIVSAVGHEVDVSIADFVADIRAATPSAAAELVSQDNGERQRQLQLLRQRLQQGFQRHQTYATQQLLNLQQRLRAPSRLLQQQNQRLDQLELRLVRASQQHRQQQFQQLQQLQRALQQQHPKRQLERHSQRLELLQRLLVRAQQTQLQHGNHQLTPLPQRLVQAQQHQLHALHTRLASQAQLLHSLSPLQVLARGYSLTRNAQQQVVHSVQQLTPGDTVYTYLQQGWLEAKVLNTHNHPPSPPQQGELL